jgi:hypothetical protein
MWRLKFFLCTTLCFLLNSTAAFAACELGDGYEKAPTPATCPDDVKPFMRRMHDCTEYILGTIKQSAMPDATFIENIGCDTLYCDARYVHVPHYTEDPEQLEQLNEYIQNSLWHPDWSLLYAEYGNSCSTKVTQFILTQCGLEKELLPTLGGANLELLQKYVSDVRDICPEGVGTFLSREALCYQLEDEDISTPEAAALVEEQSELLKCNNLACDYIQITLAYENRTDVVDTVRYYLDFLHANDTWEDEYLKQLEPCIDALEKAAPVGEALSEDAPLDDEEGEEDAL